MSIELANAAKETLVYFLVNEDIHKFLNELRLQSETHADFANAVTQRPSIKSKFLTASKPLLAAKGFEEITDVHEVCKILGFETARDLVSWNIIAHPNENLRIETKSQKKTLRYSMLGGAWATSDMRIRQEFYVCGLIYDWWEHVYLNSSQLHHNEAEAVRIFHMWEHGTAVYKMLIHLCQFLVGADHVQPQTKLDLVMDSMFHDIGKLMFPFMVGGSHGHPGTSADTAERMPVRQNMIEEKTYGFSHEILGVLFLQSFRFLEDTAWVTLFHHQPYLAKRLKPELFLRTTLIWAADWILTFKEHYKARHIPDSSLKKVVDVMKPAFPSITVQKLHAAIG